MADRKKIYLCINIYSLILQSMKKLTLFSYCGGSVSMVACTGNKAGYVITGTVEALPTATLFTLQEATGRNLTKLDTAVISKGYFYL